MNERKAVIELTFEFDLQRFADSSYSGGYVPNMLEAAMQWLAATNAAAMQPNLLYLNQTAANLLQAATPDLTYLMMSCPQLYEQALRRENGALNELTTLPALNNSAALGTNAVLNDLSSYYGTLGQSMYNKADPLAQYLTNREVDAAQQMQNMYMGLGQATDNANNALDNYRNSNRYALGNVNSGIERVMQNNDRATTD